MIFIYENVCLSQGFLLEISLKRLQTERMENLAREKVIYELIKLVNPYTRRA